MPCEDCSLQFTVFRRKRSCNDCKRYYCSNCLSTSKRISLNALCQRCAIFAKRPLLRTDLLQLKTKDLIFYLQSKHIPTTGCVEKDELIGLVLHHVQHLDATSPTNSFQDTDASNHFDTLKQSCQNFFSNITDNISEFASFDGKSSSKSQRDVNQRGRNNDGATHIFDQPRVSTRQIPTYASFQNTSPRVQTATTTTFNANEQRTAANIVTSNNNNNINNGCRISSPVVSLSSNSTQLPANDEGFQEHSSTSPTTPSASVELSRPEVECDCSDDELIVAFTERMTKINENCTARVRLDNERTGLSGENSRSAGNSKLDLDASSQSSFEELGAIGGISDDSKTTTDTNSSNLDQWQMLEPQREETVAPMGAEKTNNNEGTLQVAILHTEPQLNLHSTSSQRAKKVSRRRSESYLNRRRPVTSDDEVSPTNALNVPLTTQEEQSENEATQTQAEDEQPLSNCQRCGKNKSNIRRYVEKMRQHLESSQMSEADIKTELQLFLAYLEKRMKSVECSDTETVASSTMSGPQQATSTMTTADENAGIHVYAMPTSGESSRFINLEHFALMEELEGLTVKQLKEVLMLHRVDYKGCCEKQELLDRVQRLWKNFKTAPAIEKLQTNELCKICMDAPIECVILECGHMATCTSCGKVLSECPICRQYIVRVVRFFRA